ncbi:hypothetical protein [Oceanibaculum pacificum]|uniref:HPt domain-containing protein n=1 Tax=Oceanibaculum pacificum TaxID=580166 RepID=A0A154WD01_9PROT|nr:hypothetical protein [Oceanibaculum pacificum]KZD11370.1 hypothetical protein AUP43_18140 [Oceanibaculum pacificum]
MTTQKKPNKNFEVIQPRTTLKDLVGSAGKGVDPKMLAKAETAVNVLLDATDFSGQTSESLDRLVAAYEHALKTAQDGAHTALHEIYEVAHDMRGEGGSYGFPLVTRIGDSLCKYLDSLQKPEELSFQVIKLHIDSLRAVVRMNLKGRGNQMAQEIVDGLEKIVGTRP